jgi:hypothetical protein
MSNINPLNINGAYPVAGVDNDSQGFRDNFTNIKNNFAYAQSELNDLQSKAIVKSALTGTTLSNNMAGTLISSALIQDFRETEYDNGVISTNVTLDHAQGHYQRVQTNASIAIAFTNFPVAGTVGRIRLKLVVTNSAHRITLPATVTYGLQYLQDYNANTRSIGYSQSGVGTYWYEFISDDAGANITVIPLSRARNNVDYTYALLSNGTPTSPTTATVVTKLILDSTTGTPLGNVNVTLPPYPVDGSVIQISANVNVSNLYLIHANTINGNTSTLTANTHLGYTYVGYPRNPGVEKWFRTQI